MKREQPELLVLDEQVEQASRAMKAMSHPLRLKILCVLGEKHLAIMRDKGVLRTRKDANRVFYRVGDVRTLEVVSLIREVFCGF